MAERPRLLTVLNPLAGVMRRTTYQQQPPFSCYDALNVIPVDCKTWQRRCAVRPGWATFGSAAAVNCIANLNVSTGTTYLRELVVAHGGGAYKSTSLAGSFSSISGSGLDTGRNLQASPYLQILYFANSTPKKYTAGGSLATWSASEGTVPVNCTLIATWGGRIVLAGDPANPHVVSFGRRGDPDDWDFTQTDTSSARDTTGIDGGGISAPVTALMPHTEECLIVGTSNNLSVFIGNPTQGGRLKIVDYCTGPICGTAWCHTADGWLYMLTRDGLYKMPPGCGDPIQGISREKIPASLRGLDGINDIAYLEYDVLLRMIHIYVTGSNAQSWLYDIENDGFWPQSSPGSGIQAIGRCDFIETQTKSGVLVATTSGLIRLDTGTALGGSNPAYMVVGPLKIGGTLGYGSQIREAVVSMSGNTDDTAGTFTLYCGKDGERTVALPTDRRYSIAFSSLGPDRAIFPKVGGNSVVLKFLQTDTSKFWAHNETMLTILLDGREK